jgi:hypothetical protein
MYPNRCKRSIRSVHMMMPSSAARVEAGCSARASIQPELSVQYRTNGHVIPISVYFGITCWWAALVPPLIRPSVPLAKMSH